MSAIVAAVAGSTIVGVAAASSSSRAQSRAADRAADAQIESADAAAAAQLQANRENIDLQREIFEQTRADQMPWQLAGQQALQQLQSDMASGRFDPGEFSFDQFKAPDPFTYQQFEGPGEFQAPDPADIANDPGYQFRVEQAQKALESSAAARGMTMSGAQLQALERFSQGLASQEYGDAFNRALQSYGVNFDTSLAAHNTQFGNALQAYGTNFDASLAAHNTQFGDALQQYQTNTGNQLNAFNQLATMAGVGQTANQSLANARNQMGQSIGQSTMNTGNAIAQQQLGTGQAIAQNAINQGNASASAYQNVAGAVQGGINNALLYSMLKK